MDKQTLVLCGYHLGVKNKNVPFNRCPYEQDNDRLRSTLKKTKCEMRTHEFGGRLKIRQQLPLLKFFEAKPGTCFLTNIFSLDGRIWANEANSCHRKSSVKGNPIVICEKVRRKNRFFAASSKNLLNKVAFSNNFCSSAIRCFHNLIFLRLNLQSMK